MYENYDFVKKKKKRKKSCAKPSKEGILFDQAQKSQKQNEFFSVYLSEAQFLFL